MCKTFLCVVISGESAQVSGAKHDYIAGVHDCTYKVFSTDWGHGESVREKI